MNPLRLVKKAPLVRPTYLHSRRDLRYFYDYYAPMVYGHLLRRTGNASLADSILTDVFLILWQERIAFNENQSNTTQQPPLSWLLHIAYRKDLEHSLVK